MHTVTYYVRLGVQALIKFLYEDISLCSFTFNPDHHKNLLVVICTTIYIPPKSGLK